MLDNLFIKKYKVIHTFIFTDVPVKIKFGKVKPIYYHKTDKIPFKFLKVFETEYEYDEEGFLYNMIKGEKVIKNEDRVGANYININGNLIFAHNRNETVINNIRKTLLNYFRNNTKKINIEKYPVTLYFEFSVNDNMDVNNRFLFYTKYFMDAIQTTYSEFIRENKKITNKMQTLINPNGFIEDDNPKIINEIITKIIPSNENTLIIKILYETYN